MGVIGEIDPSKVTYQPAGWPVLELERAPSGPLRALRWQAGPGNDGNAPVLSNPTPLGLDLAPIQTWLEAYFNGAPLAIEDELLSLLDFKAMPSFTRRVRELCCQIPFGETMTYQQLAELAGSPKASRAVGQAMANNPYHVLIPCHRVLGGQGALTGYRGGVSIKSALLAWEAAVVLGGGLTASNVTKDCVLGPLELVLQ